MDGRRSTEEGSPGPIYYHYDRSIEKSNRPYRIWPIVLQYGAGGGAPYTTLPLGRIISHPLITPRARGYLFLPLLPKISPLVRTRATLPKMLELVHPPIDVIAQAHSIFYPRDR